ncbi:MAG: RHS repeat-associated core domain-containing protein [Bryobacteraceae bacterium]
MPRNTHASLNEARSYNTLYQLTRLTDTPTGGGSATIDFEYTFPSTTNNGKISKMKDWVTGEEVNYTYDALNRLLQAETTGSGWGQAYVFDGFNNLLQQNVTKGSAPSPTFSVDPATNRLTTTTYDANGNDLGMGTYDRANRLVTSNSASYYYDPSNKRIWKKNPSGAEEYYFYLGNQRLGTYTYNSGTDTFSTASTNLYFGGKMLTAQGSTILTDRLGSNVTGGKRYFPFGQEKPSATTNNTEKFTGYFRDAESGLDYADQRYHNAGSGRFVTPDPAGSGLNWYAYANSDPVNYIDPGGETPFRPGAGAANTFNNLPSNPTPLTPTFRVDHWELTDTGTPTTAEIDRVLALVGGVTGSPSASCAEYNKESLSAPEECSGGNDAGVVSHTCREGFQWDATSTGCKPTKMYCFWEAYKGDKVGLLMDAAGIFVAVAAPESTLADGVLNIVVGLAGSAGSIWEDLSNPNPNDILGTQIDTANGIAGIIGNQVGAVAWGAQVIEQAQTGVAGSAGMSGVLGGILTGGTIIVDLYQLSRHYDQCMKGQ